MVQSGQRGKVRTIAIVVVVLVLAGAAGLYYVLNNTKTSTGSVTVMVVMPNGVGTNQSLNFHPSTITVVIGVNNTIKWVNQDSVVHTATSTSVPPGASMFDSGSLASGSSFSVTLTTPGTYQFHCTVHPSYMIGTIIVKSG